MQTEVVLGIGGNKGDRANYLFEAREALSQQFVLISCSQVYESEAWGGVATNGNFLNQVLLLQTSLAPLALLQVTQKIELALGRTREQHWGDRTIDIDILYFHFLHYLYLHYLPFLFSHYIFHANLIINHTY